MKLKFAIMNHSIRQIYPEGYKVLKPKKKWKRIVSRILWRILDRMNCLEPYFHEVQIFEYGEPQQKAVMDLLWAQIDDVLRRGGDLDHFCVVVGGKQFVDIIDGMYLTTEDTFSFRLPSIHREHLRGYRTEWNGIPVHVVGWLDGVAVLPKVIIEMKV